MSMLTLFESIYTLKGRYNIGNVGKTASMSLLTHYMFFLGRMGAVHIVSKCYFMSHNNQTEVIVSCVVS